MGNNRIKRLDAPAASPSPSGDIEANGIPVPATAEGFAVSIGERKTYSVKVPVMVAKYQIKED